MEKYAIGYCLLSFASVGLGVGLLIGGQTVYGVGFIAGGASGIVGTWLGATSV